MHIRIYSDYVCPYCLLAEAIVQRAIGERQIEIEWHAFELRPDPIPTLRPEDHYLPKVWNDSVYPLARKLGVPLTLPSWSPQPRTAKAFELLILAKQHGLGHAYSLRVMRAFFQEDRDIGNTDVLVDLAADAGLDPDEARRALASGIYAEAHQAALRHARDDIAITSVPTIVVGDHVFRGTPPLTVLMKAIATLLDGASA